MTRQEVSNKNQTKQNQQPNRMETDKKANQPLGPESWDQLGKKENASNQGNRKESKDNQEPRR